MDVIATELRIANEDFAMHHHARTSQLGFFRSERVDSLNIETVASSPFLPTDRKWAIRFDAAGTVRLVLGMRVYAMGRFSAYFAGIVAARLGIPIRRVRVYYSVTLPAVLHTPIPSPIVFRRSDIDPIARAVADVIERMCDEVIETGRLAFAAMTGVGAIYVRFDRPTGRFFVLDKSRSRNILEVTETIRSGSSGLTEFATKPQPSDNFSLAG